MICPKDLTWYEFYPVQINGTPSINGRPQVNHTSWHDGIRQWGPHLIKERWRAHPYAVIEGGPRHLKTKIFKRIHSLHGLIIINLCFKGKVTDIINQFQFWQPIGLDWIEIQEQNHVGFFISIFSCLYSFFLLSWENIRKPGAMIPVLCSMYPNFVQHLIGDVETALCLPNTPLVSKIARNNLLHLDNRTRLMFM